MRNWERTNPQAAQRWRVVRTAVLARADDLGIRQELLLKPAYQRELAWEGWAHPEQIPILLAALGARPWQIENVGQAIVSAVQRGAR